MTNALLASSLLRTPSVMSPSTHRPECVCGRVEAAGSSRLSRLSLSAVQSASSVVCPPPLKIVLLASSACRFLSASSHRSSAGLSAPLSHLFTVVATRTFSFSREQALSVSLV